METSRRKFLGAAIGGGALLVGAQQLASNPQPTPRTLPRWRGFNLLEKFNGANRAFAKSDFEYIAELGFDFVRLPMDYRAWADPDDWTVFREETLKEIDEAVALGERFNIHVMINFHRAPGWTVATPGEVLDLWSDPEAQRVCALHWAHFAARYKGISNERVSFNLLNEPANITAEAHRMVVGKLCDAIRAVDPDRLIVCDGRLWGRVPPSELLDLDVAAMTRGYDPMQLTHYKASWADGHEKYPIPTWPAQVDGKTYDRNTLAQSNIRSWKELEAKGMGVMVGEFGAYNKTPHPVVLAWMKDCIHLWDEAGWGYALWNFRGPFGVLDSEREDVAYEAWKRYKLDRRMLDVLTRRT